MQNSTLRTNIFLMAAAIVALPLMTSSFQAFAQDRSYGTSDNNSEPNRKEWDRFGKAGSMYEPDSLDTDSIFWKPFGSFFLPGLGQYMDGQTSWGFLYTGIALGGYGYASTVANNNGLGSDDNSDDEDTDEADSQTTETALDAKDITIRKVMLGGLVAQGAGGFSTYHSFRSSVRSLQKRGQYKFLTEEETPGDILMAPLRADFLTRSTTFIPLAIGAGLAALILNSDLDEDSKVEKDKFTAADAFFTSAFSLNAGTHEEAMFRGWLMPVFYEEWGSEFGANAAQSVIFAMAHLGSNPTPLPQLLLGYHLGNVTIQRNWTLSESVFIHTWWDVIAFATQYHYKQKIEDEEAAALITPILWAPPLMMVF